MASHKLMFTHQISVLFNFMYLAADDVPVKLPAPCISLCELSLCINFNDLKEISAALCLLRSSPNLKKLEIFARIEEETVLLTPTSYCWEDIFSGPAMPIQVQHVTIDGISGIRSELDFIRFLLRYSPVLEKMIVKHVVNVQPELITELLRFKRASDEAEVIYLEKEEEASEQSEAG
ncbi:F-box/FBD/LRR-repeat protein At1g13570 isoform X3 [Medicago truncatula]|uniref:F-box/FBD/LRR-repeat protein At1g13570 isoform X3 n=1 Tax=Medicago truncatula TaxID=3880 RepID=UPI000D2F26C5|nr:F-box/FBD/LRR-repeat protein At1g13570 isoform X3 [Medicago truncatula]